MLLFAAFNVLLARWSGQQRSRGGHADCRPPPHGTRGPHRLLREHPGAAHPASMAPATFRAAAAPGPCNGPGRVHAPGPALREAGGGARSRRAAWRTRPSSRCCSSCRTRRGRRSASVTCRVSPAEIAPGDTARFDLTVSADGVRGPALARAGVQHRPVRRRHHRAPGGGLRGPAGSDRRGARRRHRERCPCRRRRTGERQLHEWQPAPIARVAGGSLRAVRAARSGGRREAIAVECGGVSSQLRRARRRARARSPRGCRQPA